MPSSRPPTFWAAIFLAAALRLHAQSCAYTEFEASKIRFRSEHLPIELSGFYPYTMSGTNPPQKYTTETWTGSGYLDVPFPGCFISYRNMAWSGAWTFSKVDFTDSSSKRVEYDTTVCVNGHVISNNVKAGLEGGGNGVDTPVATSVMATTRSVSDTRSISEMLSNEFTLDEARSRAETLKTAVDDSGSLQYWNNFSPATAADAARRLAQGLIGRTTPVTAHAERISFSAQFTAPCLGQGRFLITYYYKRWSIGQPEPAEYITQTEEVEFKDPPYLVPQSGYRLYHFPLKQGEQCKLVKLTARKVEDCARRDPGASSAQLKSVDLLFFLGRRTDGASAGALAVTGTAVSSALYSPSALQMLAGDHPEVAVVRQGGVLRQVNAPATFVDIVTLSASSYELRFYLPAQVGPLDGGTGLYAVTGQPFVTHLVENPDAGASNRIRFTENRGSSQKITLYSYDSATGTIAMSTGSDLRVERLQTSVSGSTVTETRTIENSAGQAVSVVRETKQDFAFGRNMVQRVVDPAGANLVTSYTYYTNPATDGGAYGQVRQVVEPSGHWTRYTYDAEGRPATTVTQFLDAAANSADTLNRVTAVTRGTIPDQDGDGLPEQLATTTQSLLGQEIGRSHEVIFSRLDNGTDEAVETRWDIRCTVAGAAWDAATNLVTRRRTIDRGLRLGRPVSELRPDGTLTTYAYATDAGSVTTTTTATGQADGPGATVVAGTRTIQVETLLGQLVSRQVSDIVSNTLLASETVAQTDSLGRPTRVDFLDGTYEVRSYACCGLDLLTDRQGIATSYNYNALGQIDRETRAGLTQSRTLNPEGRLLASRRIGADNSEITTETNHYDLAGRRDWTQDALGRQTTFAQSIDGSGHTIRTTTNPDGGTVIQTYARDGSLLSVSGTAAPQRLNYEYGVDAEGGFTREIHVGSSGETTEWVRTYTDFAGRVSRRVFADGAVEQSFYNGRGQLVRQVDADGLATLFAYNGRGEQEVTAIDVDGNGLIDYAGVDRVTRTLSAVGIHDGFTVQRTTTEVWETNGQDAPTAATVTENALGGFRTWQTLRGLLTTEATTLDGRGGRTVVATAPDGTVVTRTFANDRLVALETRHPSLGALSTTTYAYDAHGRLASSSQLSPLNTQLVTAYTYFADDQIQSVTTPDPDLARTGGGYDPQTTTYAYDSAGRQSQVTQPDGGVASTTFWPTGQPRRVSGARAYPVEYSYDSQGRVKTMTTWQNFAGNSGAAVTTWNYTPARGFLLNKRYADNTGPSYTYRPSGRLLTRTWARGVVCTYGYNAAGDLATVDYSDSTPDMTIASDRAGRPVTITDGSGTRTLSYDPVSSQLQNEDYTAGPLATLAIRRTFDSLSRLSSLSALSASSVLNQIGYAYDAASRLESVTSGANSAIYSYLPNSPLVGTVAFAQAGTTRLTTTKVYDNLNRLASIANAPSVSSAQSAAYAYNSANQRTKLTREDNAYWDYGYDVLGQVISAVKRLPDSTPINGFEHAWSFDDIGNRKAATVNAQISNYSANSLNQYSSRTVPGAIDVLGTAAADATVLVNGQPAERQGERWHYRQTYANSAIAIWSDVTVAGVRPGAGPGGADAVATGLRHAWLPQTPEVFTHDADGNLTRDGRWVYTWDGENRLIAMETRGDILPPAGEFPLSERRRLEFAYDLQGRRISKKVYTWNGSAFTLVSSQLFLYDGFNLIAELNALNNNAPVRTYAWGTDLSGSLQGAGGVGGLLFANRGSATHAPAFDGNGNVIGYVDMATGAKSATYEYGAFGETLIADGPLAEAFTFRFSTKYTDIETGLIDYSQRFYDPNRGRFLSRDPIEEDGGANLYGFVANDPICNVDVLGLAGFFFDGTGNNAKSGTNVRILWQIDNDVNKRYYPGVGSSIGTRIVGGLTGAGGHNRLEAAYRDFIRFIDAGDRYVDIVGFSRGAALAREFANLLNERGYDPAYGGNLKHKLRAGTNKPPGECEFVIRFVGVFDTVGSFGVPGNDINIGIRMDLPGTVGNAAQATAQNERRLLFPLTPLGDREGFDEQSFPGDHSDIGRGHGKKTNDLSRAPLEYIWNQGRAAGVPFGALPDYTPTGNTTPHDLSRKFPYNLFPKRPR